MAMTIPQKAAALMRHLCTHDGDGGHGYSQYSRNGSGGIEIVTVDGTGYRLATGDRDCSAAVISCYKALGVDCGGATYTGNMRSCMVKSGNFKAYKRPTSYSAMPGDIYLAEGRHAAMCLTSHADGDLLGQFSISEKGTIDGKEGDQTGKESNIKPFYEYPWTHTIVYTGDGTTAAPSPGGGSTASRFGDENWWGPLIAAEFISQLTGGTDDYLSGQARSDRDAFWAVSGGVEYGSGGSDAVRALQRRVGATPDGYYGRDSIRAHQSALKDAGYYGGEVDGYHGTQTNIAVCAALKAGWYRS